MLGERDGECGGRVLSSRLHTEPLACISVPAERTNEVAELRLLGTPTRRPDMLVSL